METGRTSLVHRRCLGRMPMLLFFRQMSSFQLREKSQHIERVFQLLLQLQKLRKERLLPLRLLGIIGEILQLERIFGNMIEPCHFRLRIKDQLPTVMDNSSLQIEIGTVDRLEAVPFFL